MKVYIDDPREKNFAQLFAFMNADPLWVPMSAHFSGPVRLKQVLEYTLLYDEKELSGMVINAFTSPVEFPMEVVQSMLEILNTREEGTNE